MRPALALLTLLLHLLPVRACGTLELERENGQNMYDFHARQFDYAIPAFVLSEMCPFAVNT